MSSVFYNPLVFIRFYQDILEMEKMNDVLRFLNDVDLFDKLDNDCLQKLLEVERMMVREFEVYNISKTMRALNIIDEIQLSSVTNDLDYRLERTDSLRSNIFCLISFKHLVDTNNKQEN